MLKRRLIPKLQLRAAQFGGRRRMVLVTTSRFEQSFEIGDPVSQARIYEAQAADELILLDLDASRENREPIAELLRTIAAELFMPLTVGGGVRSIEDFRRLLSHGADKVSINSAAVEVPSLITEASAKFGSQCVVLSIDYRKDVSGRYTVWTRGGHNQTWLDPVRWALEGERLGAGEILLTSIDRDGTRTGLDCELTRAVAAAVTIPVITSGGCGLAQHFVEGFKQGSADAVSAGTYFSFKDENPMQTRSQIKNAGIPIRMHGQTEVLQVARVAD
ncbi:MAG TPA: imidazole glycerol phosphate synthase cyclase subunit [Candidatus Acidoferrum sp.]|nr:imidazole glycerol phosphate synthase cyclase subunit [Candidatus Acidoferrum sp.]